MEYKILGYNKAETKLNVIYLFCFYYFTKSLLTSSKIKFSIYWVRNCPAMNLPFKNASITSNSISCPFQISFMKKLHRLNTSAWRCLLNYIYS